MLFLLMGSDEYNYFLASQHLSEDSNSHTFCDTTPEHIIDKILVLKRGVLSDIPFSPMTSLWIWQPPSVGQGDTRRCPSQDAEHNYVQDFSVSNQVDSSPLVGCIATPQITGKVCLVPITIE